MRIGIYLNGALGGALYIMENHGKQLAKRHDIYLYATSNHMSVEFHSRLVGELSE